MVEYSVAQNANVDASLRYLVGETNVTDNVDDILKLAFFLINFIDTIWFKTPLTKDLVEQIAFLQNYALNFV